MPVGAHRPGQVPRNDDSRVPSRPPSFNEPSFMSRRRCWKSGDFYRNRAPAIAPGNAFSRRSGRGCRDGRPPPSGWIGVVRGSCAHRRAAASTTVRQGEALAITARRPRNAGFAALDAPAPDQDHGDEIHAVAVAPSGVGRPRPSLVSIRNWCASMHQRDAGRSPEHARANPTAAGARRRGDHGRRRSARTSGACRHAGRCSPATASARGAAPAGARRFRTRSRMATTPVAAAVLQVFIGGNASHDGLSASSAAGSGNR